MNLGYPIRGAMVHPREMEHDATYRAYLFGTLRIYRGPDRLPLEKISRRKAVEILQWFLLNPGKPCSAEQFVELLWPDGDVDKCLGNFHVTIHALRRLLEPDLGPRQDSRFVHRHANKVYSFDGADCWWTDVADLELLHHQGHEHERAGDPDLARFCYRRVAGYVAQGPLAEDEEPQWLEPYRSRYAQLSAQSLARLMVLDAAVGDSHELVESAYQMLKVDKYNQLAARVIIEASLRSGDLHRAQHRLRAFCDKFQRDLGLPVPDEIDELRQRAGLRHVEPRRAERPPTARPTAPGIAGDRLARLVRTREVTPNSVEQRQAG